MWIYGYRKFDLSGSLQVGPFHSREEAAKAMKEYADRFGAIVQEPKKSASLDIRPLKALRIN